MEEEKIRKIEEIKKLEGWEWKSCEERKKEVNIKKVILLKSECKRERGGLNRWDERRVGEKC
jgi:hypothetical protein